MENNLDKVNDKIAKLLKLSKSPNEAEAQSAIKKAHNLLKKYNLKIEDVKEISDIKKERIYKCMRERKWKRLLLQSIAIYNYCFVIYYQGYKYFEYEIFGKSYNIEITKSMYEYLIETIERLCKNIKRDKGFNTNNYKMGISSRLIERLEQLKIIENADPDSKALVVISNEAKEEAFKLGKITLNNTYSTQDLSYYKGQIDAEDINLSKQVPKTSNEFLLSN